LGGTGWGWGGFQLLETTAFIGLWQLNHSVLCFLCHIFFLTWTLLSASYKDSCDDLTPPPDNPDNLPVEVLNLATSASPLFPARGHIYDFQRLGYEHLWGGVFYHHKEVKGKKKSHRPELELEISE
jgi:hypothetical protein